MNLVDLYKFDNSIKEISLEDISSLKFCFSIKSTNKRSGFSLKSLDFFQFYNIYYDIEGKYKNNFILNVSLWQKCYNSSYLIKNKFTIPYVFSGFYWVKLNKNNSIIEVSISIDDITYIPLPSSQYIDFICFNEFCDRENILINYWKSNV